MAISSTPGFEKEKKNKTKLPNWRLKKNSLKKLHGFNFLI